MFGPLNRDGVAQIDTMWEQMDEASGPTKSELFHYDFELGR